MNHRILITALVLAAFAAGFISSEKWRRAALEHADVVKTEPAEREILYWVAPMDPNYRRDQPGKSPMGMDLVPVYKEKPGAKKEKKIAYWVAPMDPNYRRDKPGKSPMGMDLVPVYADQDSGARDVVSIDPVVVQNLGVRTARSERSRLWRGIDTVGYVDYDESKVSHIHLRTEGWLERLYVESEGERVSRGQRLFDLYSPELVNAQEEYVQALKIGNRDLAQASRDRLLALGIPDDQVAQLQKPRRVQQTVAIYAPEDGVVATLPVREGMFVQPAMRVMSLADLSSVWLLADKPTGKLLGGCMVGPEAAAHRIDTVAAALHAGLTVEQLYDMDLAYAPPFGPTWDPCLTAANQLMKKL